MDLGRPFRTITPTLDGDVLKVLAVTDVTFTVGQIRRVLTDYSEEGIRKVLTRLQSQGVVLVERIGPVNVYRLNQEHLAAGPIVELAKLFDTFLARLESALGAWEHPPTYGAVFGSTAQGTMTVDSVVDLLLVREGDTPGWDEQVNDLAVAVSGWTGNDARIVEYTVAELKVARSEPVLQDVLDRGLTIAGSRGWLVKQLRSKDAHGSRSRND